MRYFMVAYRPGPNHRHYKHADYGNLPGAAWNVKMFGPKTGGRFFNGEYMAVTALREMGHEVVVTPLPTDWSEDDLDNGDRP